MSFGEVMKALNEWAEAIEQSWGKVVEDAKKSDEEALGPPEEGFGLERES